LCFAQGIMFYVLQSRQKELDGPAVSALSVQSCKLSNVGRSSDGWPKIYYLELLHASEDTLSSWCRLHLQALGPTNSHRARVVDYGLLSLCVIHKEGLCPSSGDINRLMMMMNQDLSYLKMKFLFFNVVR
jgi:hypothetical protein